MPSSQGSFVNTETLLALNLFSSLNHALSVSHPGTTWTWLATTLNPHYEGNDLGYMINDDRYLSTNESIHWVKISINNEETICVLSAGSSWGAYTSTFCTGALMLS